jgi:hypothetical protein
MEAMLVAKIAEVHKSEMSVLSALGAAKTGDGTADLGEHYATLQQQIEEIETLITAMDAASNQVRLSLPTFVPESALQFSASI